CTQSHPASRFSLHAFIHFPAYFTPFIHPLTQSSLHFSPFPGFIITKSTTPPHIFKMSRKRKADSGEVLKIGNKTISLEGYLTKKPKTTTPSTSTSDNNTPAPTSKNDSSITTNS